MSWAGENPELYDDLVREGIERFLIKKLEHYQYDFQDYGAITALVEVLQNDNQLREVYRTFVNLAHSEVQAKEQDYWGGLIDNAKAKWRESRDH